MAQPKIFGGNTADEAFNNLTVNDIMVVQNRFVARRIATNDLDVGGDAIVTGGIAADMISANDVHIKNELAVESFHAREIFANQVTLNGTTGSIQIARLTTSQRDALCGDLVGTLIYNLDTNKYQAFKPDGWHDIVLLPHINTHDVAVTIVNLILAVLNFLVTQFPLLAPLLNPIIAYIQFNMDAIVARIQQILDDILNRLT